MGYNTQQRYLALGLCICCGKERTGDGATKRMCALCAERSRNANKARRLANPATHRAQLKKHYDQYKAAGRCVWCGKPRTGRTSTSTFCGVCIKKKREVSAAVRQRKRNKEAGYVEGDGRNVKKWPMGAASTGKREGGEFNFSLTLDRPSLEAIQVIKKRYRDAEWKAGREPQTHQLSRLVREIIVKYEPNRTVVKPRKHRLLVEMKANLSLDGRTRAILERQAALSFNGNKSATLRAMLIECQGFRRAFTTSSLPKGVPVVFEPALPFPVRHVIDP